MAFGAAPAGLKVGQTLSFKNDDVFQHKATAKGDFDLDLKPGQSGSVVLKHAGTIQVMCRYHPTMMLTVVVRGGAP
jgi:plastocyanin